MSATSDLRAEHVGVGRMLGIMDAMRARLETGGRVGADDLVQAVDFLRVFVDACHHSKEEQLLFPAMAGISSARETIAVLLEDHVRGRELVSAIDDASQRLAMGGADAPAEISRAMQEYATLLHAHIRREENDCFGLADRELPVDVQSGLEHGYDRVEREVVGQGRHEAFHAMLDRLEASYKG